MAIKTTPIITGLTLNLQDFILERNLKESGSGFTNLPITWKIEGNKNPIVKKQNGKFLLNTENYTLIPNYLTKFGNTLPDKFAFFIEKGKILNFGRITYPTLEILWYEAGFTQLKFFIRNENDILIPCATIDINITSQ